MTSCGSLCAVRARAMKTLWVMSCAQWVSPPTNRNAVEYTRSMLRLTSSRNAGSERSLAYAANKVCVSVISNSLLRSQGSAKPNNIFPLSTEDECREDQLQIGIATSRKRQSHADSQMRGVWKTRAQRGGRTSQNISYSL